jgi:hypothetical protein
MNDIKWEKFTNSLQENKKAEKFVEFVKILLKEINNSDFESEYDDILFEMDKLLRHMNDEDEKLVKKLLKETIRYKN